MGLNGAPSVIAFSESPLQSNYYISYEYVHIFFKEVDVKWEWLLKVLF